MRKPESPAVARICRSPLATCLSTVLAIGSIAPASSSAAFAWPTDEHAGISPILDRLRVRATAMRSAGHAPSGPLGGLVLPVTSCADDGSAGTLRHVVLTASNGDTVDLSGLTCSTITLESGAVNIDVDNLTILGPGADALAIDGNNAGRVFRHGGTGTLQLTDLTATHGNYTVIAVGSYGGGGCIYTAGTVSLTGVIVSSCTATSDTVVVGGGILAAGGIIAFNSAIKDNSAISLNGATPAGAAGGGAAAFYQFVLEHSTVSGNTVSTPLGDAYGAGVFVNGGVTIKYSTLSANSATTTNAPGSGYYSFGGAMVTANNFFMQNTTIDNNSADAGAGIFMRATDPSYSVTIRNSTISSNHAVLETGGLFISLDLTLENSTIAFNTAGDFGGGGIIVGGTTADLESNIIADNSPSGAVYAADIDGSATIVGANNLIKIAGAMLTLPPDTITQDPQLGPLANNGGETRTHALPSTSPAVDAGNNVAAEGTDQRGPGYARVVGSDADIGAYELNPDIIFIGNFDSGG